MTQNPEPQSPEAEADPQSPEADLRQAQQRLEHAGRVVREALEADARLSALAGEQR